MPTYYPLRNPVALSLDTVTSPASVDVSAFSAVEGGSSSTGTGTGTAPSAPSLVYEVSPLSYQSSRSGRGRGGAGRRWSRNYRADSISDIDVPILTSMLRQATPSAGFSGGSPARSGSGSTFLRASRESVDGDDDHDLRDVEGEEDVMVMPAMDSAGSRSTNTSRRSSLSLTEPAQGLGDAVAAANAYVPPRCYHPERLLYTGVFVGFLFRSYYVGMAFFRENMPQLRRGVGLPNKFLAAILPTIGYDGGLDRQWISYLHSLPSLFLVAAALGAATRLLHYVGHVCAPLGRPPMPQRIATNAGPARSPLLRFTVRHQTVFQLQVFLYLVVGLVFFAVVHGPHFFLPLLLILANYLVFSRLQRWCPYRVFMTIMWVTHLGLLYLIELYGGFERFHFMQVIAPTDETLASQLIGRPTKPLWSTQLRWYVAFRMTTLRLIAFNYDLWEATHSAARARQRATDKHDTACVECAQLREQNSASANAAAGAAPLPAEASRCYKYRTEHARDLADYSLVNYLAYVVFPPLYLAGPMSSFNAFMSYMRVPSTAMPLRKMLQYAFRTACIFLVAYLHLHFWFIVALSERIDLLLNASPEFQSYVLYYYLAYLWLKFNFIWKSSRLFAMLSGIEVPEDMRHCFSNTTTVRNFWRDWHASFNLWIVRYMYIPMGGRGRVALSILPIFLFIALWHDPALHLVKWALCIAAMFVVELVVSAGFGWVAGVFRREMADRATESPSSASRARVPVRSPTVAPSCLTPLLRPIARWSYQHLTPFQRGTVHRELVTVGCFFSVFGLIVANMVGFCVQNSAAEVKEQSSTDALILRALREARVRYYVGLFAIIYSASGIGVSMWFWEDVMERQLRACYRLKASPIPPM